MRGSGRASVEASRQSELVARVPNSDRSAWEAHLALAFERRSDRTVLMSQHRGPLRVQKPLYQEGPDICQAIVLHPPGGIAGGDELELEVDIRMDARAIVTTPGATKWYRCDRSEASQHVSIRVEAGAVLEWMPQETIVYNGVQANQTVCAHLAQGARYLGWEVTCFGRTASGERFDSGLYTQHTSVCVDDRPLFLEYACVEGGSRLFQSPAGLAGRTVSACMLIVLEDAAGDLVRALRAVPASVDDLVGITALPGVFVARYLGRSAQAARAYFTSLWRIFISRIIATT